MYRELHEEMGLQPTTCEVLGETSGLAVLPPSQRSSFVAIDKPLCIGQRQRWFMLQLLATEDRLRSSTTTEQPEFDRWRWVDYWRPVKEVIYFKRQVYVQARAELSWHHSLFPDQGPHRSRPGGRQRLAA